jgi:Bacterial SH3 domain
MTTPTRALLLCSFLFSIALHAQTKTKPDQYVLAAGGLTLRQKPDLKSKKVKHLPFGTGIVLKANKHPDEHQTEIFTGYKVKGRWLKVQVDTLEGYVLSAFLSDLKPPQEEAEGMNADIDVFDHFYRQNSQPKGDRVYGKVEVGEVYTQKYKDGASLEVRRFEGGSMRTLTFNSNTSLTEAYLISRHLWFGEKQVKGLTYDAVKKRIACESMNGLTTLSLEVKNGRTVAVFALAD